MPESCSDLGAERHPFAVVPKGALDKALARVEELEAGLRAIQDRALNTDLSSANEYEVLEAIGRQARALLKEGER